MTYPKTPAGRLVSAFGKPADMAALYASDVTWKLPRGLAREPMVGMDDVCAFNQMVWTVSYRPDCEVEILDEVGDESTSAVRILYRAHLLLTEQDYENEYTVFVRSDTDGIHEVFEAMDTVALLDSLQRQPPGTTFGRALAQES